MNRSVRTKIAALGLCVTLMFTALTGCGNKDTKETLSTEQQSVSNRRPFMALILQPAW